MPKSSTLVRTPSAVMPLHRLERRDGVGHQLALGDLEHEPVGGQAGVGECGRDRVGELAVGEVASRDVHRHVEVEARVAPAPALRHRRRDHPAGERVDQPRDLRQLDEFVGADDFHRGVMPAEQCFDSQPSLRRGEARSAGSAARARCARCAPRRSAMSVSRRRLNRSCSGRYVARGTPVARPRSAP